MKQHEVTVPQIGLIAGTRAMLGAGIALLLSEKLSDEQRRQPSSPKPRPSSSADRA